MNRREFLAATIAAPFLAAIPVAADPIPEKVATPAEDWKAARVRWLTQTEEGRAHLQRAVEVCQRYGI